MNRESKFALVEFGECDKTGYVFIKGGDIECKNPTLAHTYWYPDDITNAEAQCEINDLVDHYDNIGILVPLPEHINKNILTRLEIRERQMNRPDSEVSAYGS